MNTDALDGEQAGTVRHDLRYDPPVAHASLRKLDACNLAHGRLVAARDPHRLVADTEHGVLAIAQVHRIHALDCNPIGDPD